MIRGWRWRSSVGPMSDVDPQLADYRSSIDNIDAALVHLLAERFKITQDVGRYKAAAGLPAADPDRMRAAFAGWHPSVSAVLDAVETLIE